MRLSLICCSLSNCVVLFLLLTLVQVGIGKKNNNVIQYQRRSLLIGCCQSIRRQHEPLTTVGQQGLDDIIVCHDHGSDGGGGVAAPCRHLGSYYFGNRNKDSTMSPSTGTQPVLELQRGGGTSSSSVDDDSSSTGTGSTRKKSWFPAGWHPLGYRITELGEEFLKYEGSLDSDIGRFVASFKSGSRKSKATVKSNWLEIVRVAKTGQAMRIYRQLEEMFKFCITAGFIG